MSVRFYPVECDRGGIFNCLAISEDDAHAYYSHQFAFRETLILNLAEQDDNEVHHITPAALEQIKNNEQP